MKADFISLLRQASAAAVNRPLSAPECEAMAFGTLMAEEFIGAARSGALPPDALLYAATLIGKSGTHGDSALRGFFQQLTSELGVLQ